MAWVPGRPGMYTVACMLGGMVTAMVKLPVAASRVQLTVISPRIVCSDALTNDSPGEMLARNLSADGCEQ